MPRPERSDAAALRLGVLALIAGCLAGAALAQEGGAPAAPRPGGPPPAAPRARPVDATFEAAQAAFQTLPEGVRREIQDALAWTGHYSSVLNAAFGRRTFDAVVAYQRALKAEPNGILGDAPRAALLAAGRRAREAAGFALRRDPATGIAIGVPARLLPREQKAAHGTRWQSPDGRVTLETRAFDPAEADLQATFDRVSLAGPERKITYRLKRPDFLVVTGETTTGRFYIRYADTPTGVRGFTLSYDKALSAEIDPVVIAVANSFDPAPEAIVPAPVSAARPPVVGADLPRPSLSRPEATPVPGRTATGLIVAPGRLLTSAAALAACSSPRVGREPARLAATEGEPGLALLAFADASRVAPVGIATATPLDADLIAIGFEPSGDVMIVPGATGAAGRILAPLQPGAAGTPVLDREGRLAGVVERYPTSPRLVAGIAPPTSYALVAPGTVAVFLARNGIATQTDPATGGRSTGEIANLFAGRVRRVACD